MWDCIYALRQAIDQRKRCGFSYLPLELRFWHCEDFLINVKQKKKNPAFSALPFLKTSISSSGPGRAVCIHCCNFAKRTISLLLLFFHLHATIAGHLRYKCLPGETCLNIFAQLFPYIKNNLVSGLSTAAGFALSLPVSAFWTRFDCGQITCCMTLLCSSIIEHSLISAVVAAHSWFHFWRQQRSPNSM